MTLKRLSEAIRSSDLTSLETQQTMADRNPPPAAVAALANTNVSDVSQLRDMVELIKQREAVSSKSRGSGAWVVSGYLMRGRYEQISIFDRGSKGLNTVSLFCLG